MVRYILQGTVIVSDIIFMELLVFLTTVEEQVEDVSLPYEIFMLQTDSDFQSLLN